MPDFRHQRCVRFRAARQLGRSSGLFCPPPHACVGLGGEAVGREMGDAARRLGSVPETEVGEADGRAFGIRAVVDSAVDIANGVETDLQCVR